MKASESLQLKRPTNLLIQYFADDNEGIRNELGDLMLHIVFYAKIGSEKGVFSMEEVLEGINNKLIYRHPHVFGDVKVTGASQVEENWEQFKIRENNGFKPVLSGVPSSLPAIVKANRIQEKVRGVGFDWEKRNRSGIRCLRRFPS